MFTQACFIRKNSKELIGMLEKLGYDYAENGAGAWFIPICQLDYLGVNLYSYGYYMGINGVWYNDWYDCGTNEDLFLALAALRDDSDKFQWFTDGINWAFCDSNRFGSYWVRNDAKLNLDTIHKATPQELIEHFKDK